VHFAWVPLMEYDDFYSLGAQIVWECEEDFDENKKAKFETYLYSCLTKRIKDRITYLNRQKRNCEGNISLDQLLSDEDIYVTDGSFSEHEIDVNILNYLKSLTKMQRTLALMIMNGYSQSDIKEILNLSDKKYSMMFRMMKTHEKTELLLPL